MKQDWRAKQCFSGRAETDSSRWKAWAENGITSTMRCRHLVASSPVRPRRHREMIRWSCSSLPVRPVIRRSPHTRTSILSDILRQRSTGTMSIRTACTSRSPIPAGVSPSGVSSTASGSAKHRPLLSTSTDSMPMRSCRCLPNTM